MRLFVLTAALAGCAPRGDIDDVPVSSAWLSRLDTDSFVMIVGAKGGDAILNYESPDGSGGALPVSVSGGALGLVFDMSLDLNPNDTVELDLSDADAHLRAPDLLGTYVGSGWSVTMGLGGGGDKLKNGAGVGLSDEHFSAGVGLEGGLEWLRVREGGHEDGGIVVGNDTSGDTTADSDSDSDSPGDTSADTDVDSGGDTTIDTGRSGSGGGCGGAATDSGGGGGSSGAGCDCSSGSGCDSASGCGCTTTGVLQAPLLFSAILVLRRRRREAAPPDKEREAGADERA